VLNDMSSVYADYRASVRSSPRRWRPKDYGTEVAQGGSAQRDHQNKPDVGANIARQWFDTEGVELILDIPNSAVALAVSNIVREKNKVFNGSGAGTSLRTRRAVQPQHRAQDLRHLCPGALDRQCDHEARRQELVLRHRRLRPSATTWRSRRPKGS